MADSTVITMNTGNTLIDHSYLGGSGISRTTSVQLRKYDLDKLLAAKHVHELLYGYATALACSIAGYTVEGHHLAEAMAIALELPYESYGHMSIYPDGDFILIFSIYTYN